MKPTDERDRLRELIAAMGQHVGGVRLEVRAPIRKGDPIVMIVTHPLGIDHEKDAMQRLAIEMLALGFDPPKAEEAYETDDISDDAESP